MSTANKLLRVNLSKSEFTEVNLPKDLFELYLGGKTLGFYLALTEGLASVEPLSPDNKIYILTGPLTGYVSGGGATAMVTKSPLTNTLTDPIAQSNLGYSIKSAGYDGLVIEGKAKDPSYLAISNSGYSILPAEMFWGKPCSYIYRALRDIHGDIPNNSVLTIGQAGENLVRFASVMADTRAFGRGGAGAVFGSKNLKGIIVGGDKFPRAFDEDLIDRQHRLLQEYVYSDQHPYQEYQNEGTGSIYRKHVHTGCMSGWNYRKFNYEDLDMLDLGDAVTRLFTKDPSVCFKCYLSCARSGSIKDGQFKGEISNGPEFETVWAFGPQVNNNLVNTIVDADLLCDEMGMDSLSAGNVIGFYFECLEKGYFGHKAELPCVVDTLNNIALRRGDGDLLAEGVKRASEHIGQEAPSFAMHVKGLETPAYDPRGFNGIALAYSISARGGCHRKAFCPEEAKGKIDGSILEGKAEMVILEEHKAGYRDSLVVCKWGSAGQVVPYYADALYGSIGVRMNEDVLIEIGSKAINMARIFNILQGFTREHDTLPSRFFDEPKYSGPLKGKLISRIQLELLKDLYYEQRGWTKEGIPQTYILEKLGLEEFVKSI